MSKASDKVQQLDKLYNELNPYLMIYEELKKDYPIIELSNMHLFQTLSQEDIFKMFDNSAALKWARHEMVHRYSWAIPNEDAIQMIINQYVQAGYMGIVDMFAGTGYWAWMLKKRGVYIESYDKGYGIVDKYWTRVIDGGPDELEYHGNKMLLVVWPSLSSVMDDVMEFYTGNKMIYVGETGEGCTGWSERINDEWEKDDSCDVSIPNWPDVNDYLSVWNRKGTGGMESIINH